MFNAAKVSTFFSLKFLLISLLSLLIISFSSYSADFATGFEFTDTTGEFTRGTSPNTVTFKNGHAKTAAIASLYHDGMNAFMVQNNTGMVEFETPAGMVDVWLRAQTGAAGAEVRVYDINSNLTNTFMATTQWQQITLTSVDGISRLELVNNSSSYAVFDTFSFTAIDSPPGPLDDPLPIPIAEGGLKLKLELLASGLVAPLWGTSAPGVTDFIYVIDQVGSIWAINTITGIKTEIANLSSLLVPVGIADFGGYDERGLLGIAFHPDFVSNGKMYTYTSELVTENADFSTMPVAGTGDHQSVLREWSATIAGDSGIIIDNTPSRILFTIEQPQFNHNGGALAFDSSGLLYVSLGDGGNADDQGEGHGLTGNAQDNSNLLGTIVRIDPMGSNSENGNYGVPANNPFVNTIGREIFAFGLRNPYRMSFDVDTGDLYVADVGQNAIEEVNIVTVGGNYGWNKREGSFGFDANDTEDGFVFEQVDAMGTINPTVEYDHDEGRAVIGGFIYRGQTYENLQDRYLFADYDGPIFYINKEQTISTFKDEDTIDFGKVLGFGQDANNELYLLANTDGLPNGNSGSVYKVTVLPNTAPVANAGPDQTVNEGTIVNLDASASSDIDGDRLIYQWTQLAGTTVSLSDITEEKPSFTAPTVAANETLTFQLEVHDDHLPGEFADEVDILVQNAVAPEPKSGGGGGGGALSYLWLLAVLTGFFNRNRD
ncbi:PQQ-dependent sugar dehydrogenase [Thalassotalea fonticola]|uniref:PQQ-dependent sugar dehydrogenase n=1 Tax=Thalassotalea fonticola TaxID=3065649 RepID=A0ABZ0GNE3_9GAMM|nr:PQQ-dependent sugar dehydrogenase [Colwelliaceae bacterium S1-1]